MLWKYLDLVLDWDLDCGNRLWNYVFWKYKQRNRVCLYVYFVSNFLFFFQDLASTVTFDISSQSTSTRQTSGGRFRSDAASGVSTLPKRQSI